MDISPGAYAGGLELSRRSLLNICRSNIQWSSDPVCWCWPCVTRPGVSN